MCVWKRDFTKFLRWVCKVHGYDQAKKMMPQHNTRKQVCSTAAEPQVAEMKKNPAQTKYNNGLCVMNGCKPACEEREVFKGRKQISFTFERF